MIALKLDDLGPLLGLPDRTHLKVDVDGSGAEVLASGERVLSSPTLREIQVEVPYGDDRVARILEEHGFARSRRAARVVNLRFVRAG